MPIPDEQAAPKPAPPPKAGEIQEKYRRHVYILCNRLCKGKITADEWEAEIRKLEQMK